MMKKIIYLIIMIICIGCASKKQSIQESTKTQTIIDSNIYKLSDNENITVEWYFDDDSIRLQNYCSNQSSGNQDLGQSKKAKLPGHGIIKISKLKEVTASKVQKNTSTKQKTKKSNKSEDKMLKQEEQNYLHTFLFIIICLFLVKIWHSCKNNNEKISED